MARGKTPPNKRPPSVSAVNQRQIPWGTVTAIVVIVVMAAAFIGYPLVQRGQNAQWSPSEENPDPSLAIPGIVTQQYQGGEHVRDFQQVAYTRSPPFGGAHDGFWAACNGVVYSEPVRSENLGHSLEHGAAWIAYNPEQVTGEALQSLRDRVEGEPYTVMSPYPGLDAPISLQSWGHQLKVQSAEDERIEQFIRSLRANRFTHPEVGASCDARPQGFDQDNPPPFRPAPPVSAVDGQTVIPATQGAEPTAQPGQTAPAPGR